MYRHYFAIENDPYILTVWGSYKGEHEHEHDLTGNGLLALEVGKWADSSM